MIEIKKGKDAIAELLANSEESSEEISRTVSSIIFQVRKGGDLAVRELSSKFGDERPKQFALSREEIDGAVRRLSDNRKSLIEKAAKNIRKFADVVMDSIKPVELDQGGWKVGLEYRPVRSVGCYVPGGRFPLPSSALMTAITASSAGVKDISMASPGMCDEIIYAGSLAGVSKFYRVGGAQAIAAMAFGTESIEAVDMIVGPGNAYVTEAKKQLSGQIGIDMLAGPSEVVIIADGDAPPKWVALDMLAQAEHDPRSRSMLFTSSEILARAVIAELKAANVSELLSRIHLLLFESLDECVDASNRIAPEHLQLMVAKPETIRQMLTEYGALFEGYNATVPFGDYMAGPNHTLPTWRSARFSEGLNPRTFLRAQSYLRSSGSMESIASDTAEFAEVEGLSFHARAASARKNN